MSEVNIREPSCDLLLLPQSSWILQFSCSPCFATVRATEFRIVYVEDEWVENRDLVSSELAWEIYDVAPTDRAE